MGKESLEQLPNVRSRRYSSNNGIIPIRKARADGLIHVEHVSVFIPTVRIQGRGGRIVVKLAGSIFLIEVSCERFLVLPSQPSSAKVTFGVCHTWNKPIMDEHPGPPLSHIARGAVLGSFRDSKNQNHMLIFSNS